MLRFVIFGYPVVVHWWFWILCLFVGMNYADQPGRDAIIAFLSSAAVLFISILLHELGHAWARKRCGSPRSEILLHGMGGLCSGPGYFTRNQSVFISAMGPVVNFILAGIAFLMAQALPASGNVPFAAIAFISMMYSFNLWIGLFNLLPIWPLDGGQIFHALTSNKSPGLGPKVGMILGGICAVAGMLLFGSIFMLFLFGYLAYINYQRSIGRHQGFM